MLSFGIEYERAFSIAFCSARLFSGSPPPSFAATMIARVSFEKSLPRFASAAPFLCLIEDHLLCPDTGRLLNGLEEQLVHARILRQLGMEGGDEDPSLPQQHGLATVLGQHLHVGPRLGDARRADEDAAERHGVALELEVCLEARDLPPVGVAPHGEIDETKMVPAEQDHPRAGAEDGPAEAPDRLLE